MKDFYSWITESFLKHSIVLKYALSLQMKINISLTIPENHYCLTKNKHGWKNKKFDLFDVTMRKYDGVEIYNLVGAFLLHKLSQKFDEKGYSLT